METLIKYKNRKYYSKKDSKYKSLEEIGAFVRAGKEVCVIDRATGADVTASTLSQVLVKQGLDKEALVKLIRG